MIFHDYRDVVKAFARLYKYSPGEVMDLTVAEIWSLLPEEVEKAIVQQRGQARQQEQLVQALISLKARTGRKQFDQGEVNAEIMRLAYGK